MTAYKLHTEAAIISYLNTALTFLYFYKRKDTAYINYNCAIAIMLHWNKLHKRTKIDIADVLAIAIDNYNDINNANTTGEDFFNQIEKVKTEYAALRK